jgi:hypothetical protein
MGYLACLFAGALSGRLDGGPGVRGGRFGQTAACIKEAGCRV